MAHVTAYEVYTFLVANYGHTSVDNLCQNHNRMLGPFDFNSPIEGLFLRIEQCQRFVLSGQDPYTLVQLHNIDLQHIITIWHFPLDVCEYQSIDKALKTYKHYKPSLRWLVAQVRQTQLENGNDDQQGFSDHVKCFGG